MSNTAVFYGSTTGNTENVAKQIADKLNADLFDVSNVNKEKLGEYNNLVLGSSTWGIGDLQDDWDEFISELEDADLSNKTIALFGLGDEDAYPDSFVDAIGTIYKAINSKGANIVGMVDTNGYNHAYSTAIVNDKFVGLPLNEDNASGLTKERIDNWINDIRPYFK